MNEINIDVLTKQRDILFEACKKVATDSKCPSWASKVLSDAVRSAKQYRADVAPDTVPGVKPIEIGATVKVTQHDKSGTIYKIVAKSEIVLGVQLYNLQVIKSGAPELPLGKVRYNVPETWLITC